MMNRLVSLSLCAIVLSFSLQTASAQSNSSSKMILHFESSYFLDFCARIEKCYPENFLGYGLDFEKKLPFLDLKNGSKKCRFFYKCGRILTEEKLENYDDYQPLYCESYPKEIPDPETFSKERIERLLEGTKRENRRTTKPHSFTVIQDFIFGASSRKKIEQQIVSLDFLGCRINVHRKIKEPLQKVQRKLYDAAHTNSGVERFIYQGHTISGYNWREVRDTYQKSSHSWGISIDYLPSRRGGRQIYWRWVQENAGNAWVTLPLKYRWIPDSEVIRIFESEGFIWGGKWDLWDNMHFEYHPEILAK